MTKSNPERTHNNKDIRKGMRAAKYRSEIMSSSHGETVMQKPINEYALYLKSLIPKNIPKIYALNPMFENVADEENIRNGIIAFRDYLYLFCERLISDGHLYSKPRKTKNLEDYLSFDKIICCGGSWMVKGEFVKNGEFDKIRDLTAEARKLVDSIRK